MKDRDDRTTIGRQISDLEQRINALRIRYEQYFAGAEKRAPLRECEDVQRELRLVSQRKIMQTELRYKFQNLASRFHLYLGMWERLQREMDEGRSRHQIAPRPVADLRVAARGEVERLYMDYQNACQHSTTAVAMPTREQLEKFIQQQREKLQHTYGNVECQFRVTCENGKPKIKVSLKR